MLIDKKSYGLFVTDRAEAAYGIASGKRTTFRYLVSNIWVSTDKVAIYSTFQADEGAHNFFKRATEHACSYWLPELENIQNNYRRSGIATDFVVKNEYFHHEITKIAKTTLM